MKKTVSKNIVQVIRLSITIFIALQIFVSAWIVIQYHGKYTQGDPSPSEIHSLMVVDKEETFIDVEVEKATPLMFYLINRDNVDKEDYTNTSAEKDSERENSNYLGISRNLVLFSLCILIVSELLILFNIRYGNWLRLFSYCSVILSLIILVPLSYVVDIGDGSDDQFQENESNSFVHEESISNTKVTFIGFEIDILFSGYDLGLVTEANRSNVAKEIPPLNSEDSQSYIELDSKFSISLGKNIPILFVLPIAWYFLPSASKYRNNTGDAKESEE